MRGPRALSAVAAFLVVTGCGGDKTPTRPTAAQEWSERFGSLADSVERVGGDPSVATSMRAMSEVVHATGGVSTIALDVDGAVQSFHAVAVQLRLPADLAPCNADPDCLAAFPELNQALLAWRGESADQFFVILSHKTGSLTFEPPVPYVSDGSGAPISVPLSEFTFGVYADRPTESVWLATLGTAVAGAPVTGETCPAAHEATPGVAYECHRADFRYAVDATFFELPDEPLGDGSFGGGVPGDPFGAEHHIVMSEQPVAGAAVVVTSLPPTAGDKLARTVLAAPLRLLRAGALHRSRARRQ
jgi:hypothetical protein